MRTPMSDLVVPLDGRRSLSRLRFGGKAATLQALVAAGFDVPGAFALAREAVPRALREAVTDEPADLERAQATVLAAPLSEALLDAVARAYEALGGGAVAVRSSTTTEDLSTLSGAGIQDSFLNVTGLPALSDAIRATWASFFTERAVGYLRQMGVSLSSVGLGIVVQRMVRADVAGVLFTRDPVTGGRETIVNAAWGLGPSVASGLVSPDTFVVDPVARRVVRATVGDKRSRVVAAREGVEVQVVSPEQSGRACLEEAAVLRLATLGERVAAVLGGPQDVEWAVEADRFWLLQARPITALPAAHAPSDVAEVAHPRAVWSNVNVGEALPGVASPLTWSILAAFSDLGFRRAFASLGCKAPKGVTLVGNFRGRIYLNLSAFMTIASQVPGLEPRTLVDLGGGGGANELEATITRARPWGFLARLPLTAARFVAANAAVGTRVARFDAWFVARRRAFAARDLGGLSWDGLVGVVDELDSMLRRTGALMLTCASNFLSAFLALGTMLARMCPDEASRLQLELLAGSEDVESAAPGRELARIAALARDEPAALRILTAAEPGPVHVEDLPATSAVRRALEGFLATYGYRAVREAELMTPRWREDPTLLFATLRLHLAVPRERVVASDPALTHRRAIETVRARAGRLGAGAVEVAARRAARFAALRERLRARVTEVLGMYRALALELGRRLGDHEAAFMLTIGEIRELCAGRLDPRSLEPRVRARRAQWERDRRLPDPPRTFVGEPPIVSPDRGPGDSGGELEGLPASPGVVTGPARVLTDPSEASTLREGEVLVVQCADVGWAPLFLVAAAVVAELGGTLSHASIVAREYGVPAVVNVANATRIIRTGDRVTVSGDRGRVIVVREPASP
jgi:pyruvate,water dikinase